MVMSVGSNEQNEEVQAELPINQGEVIDVGEVDVSGEEPTTEPAPSPEARQPDDGATAVATEAPVPDAGQPDLPPEATQEQQAMAQQLSELQKMRQANSQKEWEQNVMRRAQALERRAQEQGADPQTARQSARQYVAHQNELRQQETTAFNVLNFVEGQKNAAMHFAQKYKLVDKAVIDDLSALARFKTPQEMEHEAKRMSQLRSQSQEIARLKQGRVSPQTFDNSQGAAEASTNDQRLLDAYNAGDRSDAAVRAARRMAFGA